MADLPGEKDSDRYIVIKILRQSAALLLTKSIESLAISITDIKAKPEEEKKEIITKYKEPPGKSGSVYTKRLT